MRVAAVVAGVVAVTILVGCTPPQPQPSPSPSPTVDAQPQHVDTSTLRTIIDSPVAAPPFTLSGQARAVGSETASLVRFDSNGLSIAGVLRTPAGSGPFPVVVVVHGSVDRDVYESGRDQVYIQRALLENGYAVFALDLRGYGESDPDPLIPADSDVDPVVAWMTSLDWGMGYDVAGALRLLRSGALEGIDPDRIGLVGHSLGGLVSQGAAVIAPESVDAVVSLAAPSSWVWDNVEAMLASNPAALDEVVAAHGTPETNPVLWADVSPRTFASRSTSPLLLIHGSADNSTLSVWSTATAAAWQQAGAEANVIIIEGADHALAPDQNEAAADIIAGLDAALRG